MKYIFYSIKQIDNDEVVYIGSTTNYKQRINEHKSRSKNENDKDYNKPLYIYIRDNGGFNNFIFDIIDEVECECKKDALTIENKYINEYNCKYNKQKPGAFLEAGGRKEYYEVNKQKISEYGKLYREANKQKKSQYMKEYYARKKEQKINQNITINNSNNININN